MQLKPIIKSKMEKYATFHELKGNDSLIFEAFINDSILTGNQSGATSLNDELLTDVHVGGSNDMGLDGVCIKINGMLIHTIEEAQDIVQSVGLGKVEIEYIFIQSKYKEKIDSKEFGGFLNGVDDFIADESFQPMNDKIKKWLAIKNYLNSDEALNKWDDNPVLRLYYVTMGTWLPEQNPHTVGYIDKFRKMKESNYKDVYINIIDERALKKLCDNNENQFSVSIDVIDTLEFPEVSDVNGSLLIVCSADEFIKLVTTEDHLLRKSLFNDNVRDYQGETTINQEIFETIDNCPEKFVLMNNGITIVCSKMRPGNRRLTVHNPRIVNGCQTCSILYRAHRKGKDLSKVVVASKIISTDDLEVTRKILRGTNRQNIVYDEAFECTREFHKELEELFLIWSDGHEKDKIVYERRSKQYSEFVAIKSYQKISFQNLIQSFVSIFLLQPHIGYRHESVLLQKYKGRIFLDQQSKLPYYVSSLISSKLEYLFKQQLVNKQYRPYKSHLEMIICLLANPNKFDIIKEKEIDIYCKDVLNKIYNDKIFRELTNDATQTFDTCVQQWIENKGEHYKYGIKDSEDFTNELISLVTGEKVKNNTRYEGKVVKTAIDRNGKPFGFILNDDEESIFFHSADSKDLNFDDLLNQRVSYTPEVDIVRQTRKAIGVKIMR